MSLRRWVGLCAVAESVGLTAAATASRLASSLGEGSPTAGDRAAALGLIVAGGLVEGTALGLAQSAALAPTFPWLPRARFVLVTVGFAGLGWATASLPAVLAGDDGEGPPLLLAALGGVGVGAAMGALLGAIQALVLRVGVPHPWRWVGATALAWMPAMGLIFAGASAPGADWPLGSVAALGTLTGAVAGALLGLVLGRFVPALTRVAVASY